MADSLRLAEEEGFVTMVAVCDTLHPIDGQRLVRLVFPLAVAFGAVHLLLVALAVFRTDADVFQFVVIYFHIACFLIFHHGVHRVSRSLLLVFALFRLGDKIRRRKSLHLGFLRFEKYKPLWNSVSSVVKINS